MKNRLASSPSNVIWPGTTGTGCGMPSAPRSVTTAPGNNSAVVSWAPAASGCVAGYIVTPYLGPDRQMSTLINGEGTTTVIGHLVTGGTYRFTVSAENGSVAGPASPKDFPRFRFCFSACDLSSLDLRFFEEADL